MSKFTRENDRKIDAVKTHGAYPKALEIKKDDEYNISERSKNLPKLEYIRQEDLKPTGSIQWGQAVFYGLILD